MVNYSGSGVLVLVQATGGGYEEENRLKITIDGTVWKQYLGIAEDVGTNGWNIADDDNDDNDDNDGDDQQDEYL